MQVESVNSDDVTIAVNGTEISITGIDDKAIVAIYNIGGELIYSGESKAITVPAHGVYIIKVAGITKKVIL